MHTHTRAEEKQGEGVGKKKEEEGFGNNMEFNGNFEPTTFPVNPGSHVCRHLPVLFFFFVSNSDRDSVWRVILVFLPISDYGL